MPSISKKGADPSARKARPGNLRARTRVTTLKPSQGILDVPFPPRRGRPLLTVGRRPNKSKGKTGGESGGLSSSRVSVEVAALLDAEDELRSIVETLQRLARRLGRLRA